LWIAQPNPQSADALYMEVMSANAVVTDGFLEAFPAAFPETGFSLEPYDFSLPAPFDLQFN